MAAKTDSVALPMSLFKGLVVNPAIKNRDFNSAQLCSNINRDKSNKASTRPPVKCVFADTAFQVSTIYPFTYDYFEPSTGENKQELIALTYTPSAYVSCYRYTETEIEIAYAGAGSASITLTPTPHYTGDVLNYIDWRVVVTANGVSVYDQQHPCATTYLTEGTLNNLLIDIDALANFTVTPTPAVGDTYSFVDAIPYTIEIANGGSSTFEILESEVLLTLPDTSSSTDTTDPNFTHPCALNYSNVLYFAFGTYEYKYDGHAFYRSGLPQGVINSLTEDILTGGDLYAGTYIYKVVYVRYDNQGNVIESEDSDDTLEVASITVLVDSCVDIEIQSADGGLFNMDHHYAHLPASAQMNVNTITVDAGHTMIVGDTALIWDSIAAEYVTRLVTAVTATSITIEGDPVNVGGVSNNFDVISNNVRIQIWRTKVGGIEFYLANEIPSTPSSVSTTVTFKDSLADRYLIEPFTEQLRKNTMPPKCKFLMEYQGLKLSAGDPDNPNRVMWTTPNNAEGYPLASNLTDVKGGGIGSVTGFGKLSADRCAVFKEYGHVTLDGTLDDLAFKVNNRANTGIGCTSFRSLAYIGDNDALIGLSRRGIFINSEGNLSLAVGENINALIPNIQTAQVVGTPIPDANWENYKYAEEYAKVELVLKRAIAINDNIEGKYHLFIPAEIGVPGTFKMNLFTQSKYLVFDYDTQVPFWTEYTFNTRYRQFDQSTDRNVMPSGGFCVYKNQVHFGSQMYYGEHVSDDFQFNAIFKYNNDLTEQVEQGFPVYLDIHYTPITRDQSSMNKFFKPLLVNLWSFLQDSLADPTTQESLPSDYSISLKILKDLRNYKDYLPIMNRKKVIKRSTGQQCFPWKVPTSKTRAVQIVVTNGDNALTDTEPPVIDEVEFIFTTPYDLKQREPRGSNG